METLRLIAVFPTAWGILNLTGLNQSLPPHPNFTTSLEVPWALCRMETPTIKSAPIWTVHSPMSIHVSSGEPHYISLAAGNPSISIRWDSVPVSLWTQSSSGHTNYNRLQQHGFLTNLKKSTLTLSQKLKHFEMILGASQSALFLTPVRAKKTKTLTESVVRSSHSYLTTLPNLEGEQPWHLLWRLLWGMEDIWLSLLRCQRDRNCTKTISHDPFCGSAFPSFLLCPLTFTF